MPDPVAFPLCAALGVAFAGKLLGSLAGDAGAPLLAVLAGVVEDQGKDAAKDAFRQLLRLAGDTALDPTTGLPRNHDLNHGFMLLLQPLTASVDPVLLPKLVSFKV